MISAYPGELAWGHRCVDCGRLAGERLIDFDADRLDDGAPFDNF